MKSSVTFCRMFLGRTWYDQLVESASTGMICWQIIIFGTKSKLSLNDQHAVSPAILEMFKLIPKVKANLIVVSSAKPVHRICL